MDKCGFIRIGNGNPHQGFCYGGIYNSHAFHGKNLTGR